MTRGGAARGLSGSDSCLPMGPAPCSSMLPSRNRGAMQLRVFLIVPLLVLLASARAEDTEEASLLSYMQGYVQHASKTAQEALTKMQDLQVAQNARGWMSDGLNSLRDYWSSFTDRLSGFWDPTPENTGPTPAPSDI